MDTHARTRCSRIQRFRRERGVTAAELLVVAAILVMLAAVAFFAMGSSDGEGDACEAEVAVVDRAAAAYAAEHEGELPADLDDMIGGNGLLRTSPEYVVDSDLMADGSITTDCTDV